MSNLNKLDEKETRSGDISGVQKAALLLIALNIETASTVFKYLDPEQVEKISAEITRVKNIPSKTVDNVMQDFYDMVTAREYVLEGGLEYAQAVLELSLIHISEPTRPY